METLDDRRARLHHELREACDDWLRISASHAADASVAAFPDVSGCPASSQPEWFHHLAAKRRPIRACADRRETSDAE